MSQISADLEFFCQGLKHSQESLNQFSNELESRLKSILNELKKLKEKTEDLKKCDGSEWVRKKLESNAEGWIKAVSECVSHAENSVKGTEFQHKFEKQALVIVFGIVKAGKSTLGNFIRGRAFSNASFDNPYKPGGFLDMVNRKITVEESGRNDTKTKDWFDEASVESTCSAQYFTMPGLVWVDTPGIGAIVKKDDTVPLEKLAEKFVSYADVVVFLCNSSAPGVRQDIEAFCKLQHQNKKIIGIITRSDTVSKPMVVNGKPTTKLIPKDKNTRHEQESYLCSAIKERGIPENKVDAISISTLLASKAIEAQDDNMWIDSNMGSLYKKIVDIIGNNEILELKKRGPKDQLKVTIDTIIGNKNSNNCSQNKKEIHINPNKMNMDKNIDNSYQHIYSLENLWSNMNEIKTKLDEKFAALSPNGDLLQKITDDTINSVRADISRYLTELEISSKSKDSVELNLGNLKDIINKKLLKALNSEISSLLDGYEMENLHYQLDSNDITAKATRSKEEHKFEYHDPQFVEREPDGIIENVFALFGKKYYKADSVKKEGSITIDLGFDFSKARNELINQLLAKFPDFIKTELECIRKDFFGAARDKVDVILYDIKSIEKKLKALEY